jgi:hypothetical protein
MLTFGNTPVPWTVSWTEEQDQFVGHCPWADRPALCMPERAGVGRPFFGKPHADRQREAIAKDRCDLCGKTLANRTKVSLSHARPQPHGAQGWAILQVEPMLHKECAAVCLRHCPSLKRDVRNDTLRVRQVQRSRVQFAVMSPEFIHHYVPGYVAKPLDRIIGHAKVELLQWKDRDEAWLARAA